MDLLLSIPSPSINGFNIGPLRIHFYALCILAGIIVAFMLGNRRWRARGGNPATFEMIVLVAVPSGIVGARIYHVLTHWGDYFAADGPQYNPFAIWEGGLAIFGGIMFGALGAFIACRLLGAKLLSFGDAVAPGIIFAQAIGRLGNWFNQELFGGPDDGPLGLEIDRQHRPADMRDVETFQPTFLYEMTWNLLGGFLLLWLDRRIRLGNGRVFALYLVIYGTGRFFIEGIRTDFSYMIGPLRTNQFTAAVIVLIGIALFLVLARLRPGREQFVQRPKDSLPIPGTAEDEPSGDTSAADSTDSTANSDEDTSAPTADQKDPPRHSPADRGQELW